MHKLVIVRTDGQKDTVEVHDSGLHVIHAWHAGDRSKLLTLNGVEYTAANYDTYVIVK